MIKVKFYGIGGQGVVTAGKLLSTAVSLFQDEYAITVPAYGHERRGGPVFTDVVIDSKPILVNCFVYEPDIVVVLDDTVPSKGPNVGKGITKDTILVINCEKEDIARKFKEDYGFGDTYYANATQTALDEIGINIPNSAILGLLAKTGRVDIKAVELAIEDYFKEKGGEKNARAARKTYKAAKKI